MSRSFKHSSSIGLGARVFGIGSCFLTYLVIGLASSASARDVKVPELIFDEAVAREFPQAIYDKITAKRGADENRDVAHAMRWHGGSST